VVFFEHIWQRKKNVVYPRAFYIYGHFLFCFFHSEEVDQNATAGYPVFLVNKSAIYYYHSVSSTARALARRENAEMKASSQPMLYPT